MSELLERETARTALEEAFEESRSGHGRVVLIEGEAGIGKTSLVRQTARELGSRGRFLWGACDPLLTPRALGPVHDIARAVGGALEQALSGDVSREALFGALLDQLEQRPPTVIVFEDLHWADEASLDAVAFIGRRIERTTGTLIVTHRSEDVGARSEVSGALGSIPSDVVRRIELSGLSVAAVAELAGRAGREDAGTLHELTGGNPFFLTEVLTSGLDEVPASVRDSMVNRLAQISEAAREAAELAAVVPGRAQAWLLREALGEQAAALEECLHAGILTVTDEAVGYRHELARLAVDSALDPARQAALDRRVLGILEKRGGIDPARLAHHARRTRDAASVLRHAPHAARSASAAGAHREALSLAEAALAAAAAADPRRRAELLGQVSIEAYLCGRLERALEARREALTLHEATGDLAAVGESTRWLARLLWWSGDGDGALAAAAEAVELLEPLGPSSQLGMAYSTVSQLHMVAWRHEQAIETGLRAIDLARELEDEETLLHALTNVGSSRLFLGDADAAEAMLTEAFERAAAGGFHDHAARVLTNRAFGAFILRRADSERMLDTALAYAREHELDGYAQNLLGVRARHHLERGEWQRAERDAGAALDYGRGLGVTCSPALVALGLLKARRGDSDAAETLDEAGRVAAESRELQRIGPAVAARAELAWLEGDIERVATEAGPALRLADSLDPWTRGRLGFLLWRTGQGDGALPGTPEPYRLAIEGDPLAAATEWEALGCPYEAAEALSLADDPELLLRALATFDRLGARTAAARVRRQLRERGVRTIPRGPRPSTRARPAGLTARQEEVLRLIAAGHTNAEIAGALVISTKTVDHHVSAILAKLGVASRREAARAARELGIRASEDGEMGDPR